MGPAITISPSRDCARRKPVVAIGIAFSVQEIAAVPATPRRTPGSISC